MVNQLRDDLTWWNGLFDLLEHIIQCLWYWEASTVWVYYFNSMGYPERGPKDVNGREYDYIIVGGTLLDILIDLLPYADSK